MSLDINWAYGFSKDLKNSAQSLCMKDRNAILLLSSHNAVVYDFEHRKQTLLQGHCHAITCCAVDKSKRWIVTADSGHDNILIVWDLQTFLPVKTYTTPHSYGICALDISNDGMYVASLSSNSHSSNEHTVEQEISIWSWSAEDETAIQRTSVPHDYYFHEIRFNPTDLYKLVTTSDTHVHYWDWSGFALESYKGKVAKTDIGFYSGDFTTSIFLPDSEISLTATSQGYIIVWENKKDINAKTKINGKDNKFAFVKTAVKVVRLLECGVNVMEVTNNQYLVLGCQDGAIRFYDYYLRLEAWFEDLNAGPIISLSFAIQDCPYPYGEAGLPGLRFWVPDFIVGTKKGFVVGVESSIFDEVRKENRRGNNNNNINNNNLLLVYYITNFYYCTTCTLLYYVLFTLLLYSTNCTLLYSTLLYPTTL
jgi:cilia- and flagella-associated protein 251